MKQFYNVLMMKKCRHWQHNLNEALKAENKSVILHKFCNFDKVYSLNYITKN